MISYIIWYNKVHIKLASGWYDTLQNVGLKHKSA